MRYHTSVHCPKCGRFVGTVRGICNEHALLKVLAKCAVCGEVKNPLRVADGYVWGWGWDDFFGPEALP